MVSSSSRLQLPRADAQRRLGRGHPDQNNGHIHFAADDIGIRLGKPPVDRRGAGAWSNLVDGLNLAIDQTQTPAINLPPMDDFEFGLITSEKERAWEASLAGHLRAGLALQRFDLVYLARENRRPLPLNLVDSIFLLAELSPEMVAAQATQTPELDPVQAQAELDADHAEAFDFLEQLRARTDFMIEAADADVAAERFPAPILLDKLRDGKPNPWLDLSTTGDLDKPVAWHLFHFAAQDLGLSNAAAVASALLASRGGNPSVIARDHRFELAKRVLTAANAADYRPSLLLKPPDEAAAIIQRNFPPRVLPIVQRAQVGLELAEVIHDVISPPAERARVRE